MGHPPVKASSRARVAGRWSIAFGALALLGCGSGGEGARGGSCGHVTLESKTDLASLLDVQCIEVQALSITGDEIQSLAGLENLTSIETELRIEAPNLESLQGLNGIQSVGASLTVVGAPSLTSLEGLNSLESVGGSLRVEDSSLTTLYGLDQLSRMADLQLIDNSELTSLAGLESVRQAHGVLLDGNPQLGSLGSLLDWWPGTVATEITVTNNPALPECEIRAFCDSQGSGVGCNTGGNGAQECVPGG